MYQFIKPTSQKLTINIDESRLQLANLANSSFNMPVVRSLEMLTAFHMKNILSRRSYNPKVCNLWIIFDILGGCVCSLRCASLTLALTNNINKRKWKKHTSSNHPSFHYECRAGRNILSKIIIYSSFHGLFIPPS